MTYEFEAELWEWSGQGAWCFISVPKEHYQEIKLIAGPYKKGFGSMRVEANIGSTAWKTSIFPDSKTETYLLPVKKLVRKNEGLEIRDKVKVSITLVDF